MTIPEVLSLASELESGDIHRELSFYLRRLAEDLSPGDDISPFGIEEDRASEIYASAREKRVTKLALRNQIVSLIGDESKLGRDFENLTAREMIARFIDKAPERQIRDLEQRIERAGPGDPYLKGILNRKG